MDVTLTTHPLLATFERLRHLNEHMDTLKLAPAGAGWLSLATLLDASDGTLATLLGRMNVHFKSTNRRSSASLFFGDYAYALLALSAGCYLVDQRVPRLTAETVWVTFGEQGEMAGIALSDYGFAALEDDPAADHADCLVLPTLDALQDFLLAQATACLQPLTQAVRANSTLGIPAMWALAADYLASATTFVGRCLQQDAAALMVARQLAAKPSPLRRKRDFIHIEACGQSYELVDRISCCLYYQVEDGHYCSSCPHRPLDERVGMIQEWLTQLAAQPPSAS